jgi:hypothetical protein
LGTNRRLEALHPNYWAKYDGTKWVGYAPFGETGWSVIGGAVATLSHETQLDLSGYNLQRKTIFPRAVGIQDPGLYSFKPGAGSNSDGLLIMDVITSVPLDIVEVSNNSVLGVYPGTLGSKYDYSQVIFGMARFFAKNTTVPFPNYQQLQRTARFGSGEPNASDKLYCYRIVRILAEVLDNTSEILLPSCRQVISANIDEEPHLEYMMRLKRSYELAGQV